MHWLFPSFVVIFLGVLYVLGWWLVFMLEVFLDIWNYLELYRISALKSSIELGTLDRCL